MFMLVFLAFPFLPDSETPPEHCTSTANPTSETKEGTNGIQAPQEQKSEFSS